MLIPTIFSSGYSCLGLKDFHMYWLLNASSLARLHSRIRPENLSNSTDWPYSKFRASNKDRQNVKLRVCVLHYPRILLPWPLYKPSATRIYRFPSFVPLCIYIHVVCNTIYQPSLRLLGFRARDPWDQHRLACRMFSVGTLIIARISTLRPAFMDEHSASKSYIAMSPVHVTCNCPTPSLKDNPLFWKF